MIGLFERPLRSPRSSAALRLCLAAAAFASATTLAQSQPKNQPEGTIGLEFEAFGVADTSCGDFIVARQKEERASPGGQLQSDGTMYTIEYVSFSSWMDGYLSSINNASVKRRNFGGLTKRSDRMMWVADWCRRHLFLNYASAVDNLIVELQSSGK